MNAFATFQKITVIMIVYIHGEMILIGQSNCSHRDYERGGGCSEVSSSTCSFSGE